jgi:hypothetical protein
VAANVDTLSIDYQIELEGEAYRMLVRRRKP